MSSLQYFDYEGFGARSKKDINYSQAVRIGDRIEISGQGQ
jgi:enamine deaminase RidA (YjgF/YER057c/UK114 family)